MRLARRLGTADASATTNAKVRATLPITHGSSVPRFPSRPNRSTIGFAKCRYWKWLGRPRPIKMSRIGDVGPGGLVLSAEVGDDFAGQVVVDLGFVAGDFEIGGAEELIFAAADGLANRLLHAWIGVVALAGLLD